MIFNPTFGTADIPDTREAMALSGLPAVTVVTIPTRQVGRSSRPRLKEAPAVVGRPGVV